MKSLQDSYPSFVVWKSKSMQGQLIIQKKQQRKWILSDTVQNIIEIKLASMMLCAVLVIESD